MSLVCLDTSIVIWGVQRISKSTQAHEITKAKALIEQLEKEKTIIMIPSIVLGEFLLGIEVKDHMAVIRQFSRKFMLAPYDAQAAATFANIWDVRKNDLPQLASDPDKTRQMLKADCMIVATAYARNAVCIYSHDPHIKAFAQGFIDVFELPSANTQLNFFEQDVS